MSIVHSFSDRQTNGRNY